MLHIDICVCSEIETKTGNHRILRGLPKICIFSEYVLVFTHLCMNISSTFIIFFIKLPTPSLAWTWHPTNWRMLFWKHFCLPSVINACTFLLTNKNMPHRIFITKNIFVLIFRKMFRLVNVDNINFAINVILSTQNRETSLHFVYI